LRIFFELGLVGIVVFAGVLIWQARTVYRLIKSTDGVVQTAFTAAWLGFAGFLLSSMSDNTISYHQYYMNPLFVILGAAYGVYLRESQAFVPAPERQVADAPTTYHGGVIFGQPRYGQTLN
jgi:hypothetical protein